MFEGNFTTKHIGYSLVPIASSNNFYFFVILNTLIDVTQEIVNFLWAFIDIKRTSCENYHIKCVEFLYAGHFFSENSVSCPKISLFKPDTGHEAFQMDLNFQRVLV